MHSTYEPNELTEAVIVSSYLHTNGLMHRDIKPANLLIDDDGTVLLGDLGVAAFLWDAEDLPPAPVFPSIQIHKRTPTSPRLTHTHHPHPYGHPHYHHHHSHHHLHPTPNAPRLTKRKSFVGTPCYMAPEVINGKAYDASADIWSFGITALALTQGRAPRSLVSTKTALLQTVRDAAPELDRHDGVHTYSRALQEVVAQCLEKDPVKRPTAADLLAIPIFKSAKKKSFLVGTILRDLPPLTSRMERQRMPTELTRATMESWDFDASVTSPSLASPSLSVHSRRAVPFDMGDAENEAGYDADDNTEVSAVLSPKERDNERRTSAELYALRVRGRPGRPHLSRSGSWADADVHGTTHSVIDAPIVEVEIPTEASSPSSRGSRPSGESGESEDEHSEPIKATLAVPVPSLSSSPSASSHTSDASDVRRERPILTRITTATRQSSLTPASSGIWRRLAARIDKGGDAPQNTRRGSFGASGSGSEDGGGVGMVRRTTMAILGRAGAAGGDGSAGEWASDCKAQGEVC